MIKPVKTTLYLVKEDGSKKKITLTDLPSLDAKIYIEWEHGKAIKRLIPDHSTVEIISEPADGKVLVRVLENVSASPVREDGGISISWTKRKDGNP